MLVGEAVPQTVSRSSSLLDGAGRPLSRALVVPDNVTLVVLPPPDQVRGRLHGPELNPVERVRPHLRKRFLSLRLPPSTNAIVDARLATPGCASSPNAIGSGRPAPTHESRRSRHRLIGISDWKSFVEYEACPFYGLLRVSPI